MSRAQLITVAEPSVLIPGRLAAPLARVLNAELQRARRQRREVDGAVVEAIAFLDLAGAKCFADETSETLGEGREFILRSVMDVKTAAAALECSEQNVTALVRRGSLRGERVGGAWVIETASVLARRAARGGARSRG